MLISLRQRFYHYIATDDPNKCWLWQGTIAATYGRMSFSENGKQKKLYAHRVSYELHHPLETESMRNWTVMHTCDNPPCVNPSHLRLGTQRDNLLDCIDKGRRNNPYIRFPDYII